MFSPFAYVSDGSCILSNETTCNFVFRLTSGLFGVSHSWGSIHRLQHWVRILMSTHVRRLSFRRWGGCLSGARLKARNWEPPFQIVFLDVKVNIPVGSFPRVIASAKVSPYRRGECEPDSGEDAIQGTSYHSHWLFLVCLAVTYESTMHTIIVDLALPALIIMTHAMHSKNGRSRHATTRWRVTGTNNADEGQVASTALGSSEW